MIRRSTGTMTLAQRRRRRGWVEVLEKADPNLEPLSKTWWASLCLYASYWVGPSIPRVAKATGVSRRLLRSFARNWRRDGIWMRAKVAGVENDIEFWLNAAIGMGYLRAVQAK